MSQKKMTNETSPCHTSPCHTLSQENKKFSVDLNSHDWVYIILRRLLLWGKGQRPEKYIIREVFSLDKVKLAIIYYSSTGTNYQMAKWAEEAAKEAGAEVRVLKVKELAPPQAIDSNPAWRKHYDETQNVPEATSQDLEWADALIFSMPTRFGVMPSQMKQFLDIQGGLWAQGKLANKVVSAMSSASNPHGGQEKTSIAYIQYDAWGQ